MSRLSLTVMGATLITCSICYKAYEPNAYEVYVNGKSIAYVEEIDKVDRLKKDISKETEERFGKVNVNNNISYEKITAARSALSSDEDIKRNMLVALNIKVPVVEMFIDNKSAGLLGSEKEGESVINAIADKYLSTLSIDDKKLSRVISGVKYIKRESLISSVNTVEQVVDKVWKANENTKQPLLRLQFVGKKVENIPIDYGITIKWADWISEGQSKVENKGVSGVKRQEKQVTYLNESETDTKIIQETIIESPKNEVVLKGAKDDAEQALAMYVPSRGSISSSFGMRWGRMHEGIDIAAPTGNPIYAALDGKVTFAGWQSGYGYVIMLSHEDSIETVYGHCSKINVKVNQKVSKGQVIGKVGSTGRSTGPHLHFEVKLNGKPQDPAPYIYSKQKQGI